MTEPTRGGWMGPMTRESKATADCSYARQSFDSERKGAVVAAGRTSVGKKTSRELGSQLIGNNPQVSHGQG
ncbi:hypothetical protein HYQ44_014406 [Verticillium longisporum]|nr:hypothetical protein HYQ44_014406 [Verticillium longisporum]